MTTRKLYCVLFPLWLGMQSETEQQSWRLHVTAKANKFNFRLRFAAATHRYRPTWNLSFFRISILLKLPKFALRINSHPTNPTRGRGFFATKFTKILHRLRPRLPKKKESNAPCLKVNVCYLYNSYKFTLLFCYIHH